MVLPHTPLTIWTVCRLWWIWCYICVSCAVWILWCFSCFCIFWILQEEFQKIGKKGYCWWLHWWSILPLLLFLCRSFPICTGILRTIPWEFLHIPVLSWWRYIFLLRLLFYLQAGISLDINWLRYQPMYLHQLLWPVIRCFIHRHWFHVLCRHR